MANLPSFNTTVLASNGHLPPPNHHTVNLLFAQIHAKAAKTAANHDEHQQFY
jgi:hypothetical protein